jgi:hypothetical protein
MVKYLRNGKAPIDQQNLNKALSPIIPNSNTHFSRSIASFCRLVLNIESLEQPHWQIPPSPDQIQFVKNLPLTVTSHPIQSKANLSPVKPDILNGISTKCQDLFLKDLKATNFSWNEPWEAHWNQLFFAFLLKHWTHAQKHGAFENFPMNSSHNTPQNFKAVMKRWFMGKSLDIKRKKYLPNAIKTKSYQVKKSKWRKQVIKLIILEIFDFLPLINHDCFSDF